MHGFPNKPQRRADSYVVASSIVAPSSCELFGENFDFVKDGQINGDNLTSRDQGKTVFNWSCTLKNSGFLKPRAE
ncbi:MAG: hypothetical protein EB086_07265 [Rhodobacteraceae bacterium]|nr:hypothetical protein [Paracoccaceae bacterium]